MSCNHYQIDEDSNICGRCVDEWYIGALFELNGHEYQVSAFYGWSEGDTLYSCRRTDGNGTIYLDLKTLDQHIEPYFEARNHVNEV